MISRRTLLRAVTLIGFGSVFSTYSSAQKNPEGDARPPQTDALSLVWSTQEKEIKEIEMQFAAAELKKVVQRVTSADRWWFDTDARRWEVQRPFEPGGVDSTHLFDVTFFINNVKRGSWFVDTRKRTVTMNKPAHQ
ncbi:MAG: hypothetical protein WBO68_08305 [Pyrinomonadaceae bacterium]